MTAQQFIDKVLTLIGRLRPGQGGGPSESAMVLDMWNQLLTSWNTQHLSVYSVRNAQYALTNAKSAYTFGPAGSGADFEVGRPVKIQSAGIIRAGLRFDLEQINSKQWDAIREKPVAATSSHGLQGLLPLKLYNDNAYPVTSLHLWPTPNDSSLSSGNSDDLIWRTLLLKDTTIGNNIADHLTVQESGTGTFIKAVLRKAITSDLTVQVVKNGTIIGTITIPQATAIDQPISLDISAITFVEDEVLAWNVTASDGQQDLAGVASVTVEWRRNGTSTPLAAYLDLSTWLQVSSIASLGAAVDFPPGYQRALMYALALDVAPQFPNVQLSQAVIAIASEAKSDIQRLNVSNNIPAEDAPTPGAPAAAA